MVYSYNVETPANTTEDAPKITSLKLTKGVIRYWYIHIPKGHWGECRFRIRKGSEPILPINPEGYIKGDGSEPAPPDWIYLKSPPFALQLHSWNLDTTNNHSFMLIMSIVPLWTLTPYSSTMLEMLEEDELGLVV